MTTGPGRIRSGRSDRRIASLGLTVDTPHGPADEVAARRILAGHPTPVTRADVGLAYALAPDAGIATVRRVAAALGISEHTAQRGIARARRRRIEATP